MKYKSALLAGISALFIGATAASAYTTHANIQGTKFAEMNSNGHVEVRIRGRYNNISEKELMRRLSLAAEGSSGMGYLIAPNRLYIQKKSVSGWLECGHLSDG